MASRTRRLDIEITDSRKGHGFRDASRDVDHFDRKIRQGSSSWSSALSGFGNVATAALGAAAVGLTAVGVAAFSAVKAAEESRAATRQTTAVLESMGNVAGVTADEVAELAEQLSLKSGIDDELIQSGQNVLLTFANVRDEVGKGNDIFTRATTAALDMSVALGQDLQSSVIQIGKALNDPIRGISALQRVGVSFTAAQKEMITQLVVGGDVMGAQKVILEELENQFTGSAEAQATATDKMNVAFGNLQEKIGEELLPAFESLSTWITETGIPRSQELWTEFETNLWPKILDGARILDEEVRPAFMDLVEAIRKDVLPAVSGLVDALGKLSDALGVTDDKTGDTADGIRLLGVIFKASLFGPMLFWRGLGLVIDALAAVIRFIASAIGKVREFFGLLGSIPGRIRDAFQNRLGGLGGGFGGIVGGIAGALGGLFGAEGGIVTPRAIQRFAGGGIAGRAHGRDNVPAMLATREMVLTERDQKNLLGMIGSGTGGQAPTVINVSFAGAIIGSSREAQEWVTTALNKALRTGAGVNILPSAVG